MQKFKIGDKVFRIRFDDKEGVFVPDHYHIIVAFAEYNSWRLPHDRWDNRENSPPPDANKVMYYMVPASCTEPSFNPFDVYNSYPTHPHHVFKDEKAANEYMDQRNPK